MTKYCCSICSSRRRHTRLSCDWSSDVCSSDLVHLRSPLSHPLPAVRALGHERADLSRAVLADDEEVLLAHRKRGYALAGAAASAQAEVFSTISRTTSARSLLAS